MNAESTWAKLGYNTDFGLQWGRVRMNAESP